MKKALFFIGVLMLLCACSNPAPAANPSAPVNPSPLLSNTPTENSNAIQGEAIQHFSDGQAIKLASLNKLDVERGWGTAHDENGDTHILFTTNGGNSWMERTPPETAAFPGQTGKQALTYFLDEAHVWVVYWNSDPDLGPLFEGLVWRTNDGGLSWQVSQPLNLEGWEGGYSQPTHLVFTTQQTGLLLVGHDRYAGHAPQSVYRSDDGGLTWQATRLAMDEAGSAIDICCQSSLAMLDEQTALMTMEAGPVGNAYWNWTWDGGQSWESQAAPVIDETLSASGLCGTSAAEAVARTEVFAVTNCLQGAPGIESPISFLHYTADGGASWKSSKLPDPTWERDLWQNVGRIDRLDFQDARRGWLATTLRLESAGGSRAERRTHLWHSRDGGQSWEKHQALDGEGQVDFTDSLHGWALLESGEGTIFRRTLDGGMHWEEVAPIIGTQASATQEARLPVWEQFPTPQDDWDDILELTMLDTMLGWATVRIGERITIMRTSDGGRNWLAVTPPELRGEGVNATGFYLDEQNAWIAGAQANREPAMRTWRTQDGGRTWRAGAALAFEALAQSTTPLKLFFLNPEQGWLLAGHGVAAGSQPVSIYRSSDGGANWELILEMLAEQSGTINTCCQSGMIFNSPLDGLISTDQGPDLQPHVNWTHDGGFSWERQNLTWPAGEAVESICGTSSPSSDQHESIFVLLVCRDPHNPSEPPHDYLYTTANQGQSWSILRLPGSPGLAPADQIVRSVRRIQFTDPQNGLYTVLEISRPASAPGISVQIRNFATHDGGLSWTTAGG